MYNLLLYLKKTNKKLVIRQIWKQVQISQLWGVLQQPASWSSFFLCNTVSGEHTCWFSYNFYLPWSGREAAIYWGFWLGCSSGSSSVDLSAVLDPVGCEEGAGVLCSHGECTSQLETKTWKISCFGRRENPSGRSIAANISKPFPLLLYKEARSWAHLWEGYVLDQGGSEAQQHMGISARIPLYFYSQMMLFYSLQ